MRLKGQVSIRCGCRRGNARRIAFLACALWLVSSANAADFGRHSIRCDQRDMEYVAYVPTATATAPLPVLVLLHGAGDQAENFAHAWKSLAQKKQIVLIAPQLPRDPTLEPQIPKILPCLVDDVRKQASLDPRRVYLFGYSMGGYLAYDGALLDSDYFAAAAVHAMGIDAQYASIVQRARRKIPIYISIGDRDQMVSLTQVRKTRDLLKKSGFPVQYQEILDHTHNYYEMADIINSDVWHFLEAYRLP
jgi:poly(3-hydroxybutyrate) depolymerase